MTSWLQQLSDLQTEMAAQQAGVMITVVRVRGSAPREAGARMWIKDKTTTGTIGGGELEYQCQKIGQQLIENPGKKAAFMRNFPLGSNCGQCCGGVVDVLFETFSAEAPTWQQQAWAALSRGESGYLTTDLSGKQGQKEFLHQCPAPSNSIFIEEIRPQSPAIAVFGTGHVGTALINILSHSAYQIVCVDNRPQHLPLNAASNIRPVYSRDPAAFASGLPPATACVVMTHSHALDFDICATLLKRDDLAFYGLIGSQSKRQRFHRLFRQAGLSEPQIKRLTCPVGDTSLSSKRPGEIAITIAAQLLRKVEAATQTNNLVEAHAALHP